MKGNGASEFAVESRIEPTARRARRPGPSAQVGVSWSDGLIQLRSSSRSWIKPSDQDTPTCADGPGLRARLAVGSIRLSTANSEAPLPFIHTGPWGAYGLS